MNMMRSLYPGLQKSPEEMDKKAYEEWREEYEKITKYPLVVEYADHDY
jgi:hypothetical protein